MHIQHLQRHLPQIIDELSNQGWSQLHDFLPDTLTHELAAECRARAEKGALAPAGVGRGQGLAVREGVRGDHIQWLEPGQSPSSDRYLEAMDALRQTLNQRFYLGLEDFESHFALYPPGTFYQKHLDRFRDDDRRTVSAVFYLNPNWQSSDGGALRIYPDNLEPLDLPPQAGSLVLFMSGELPHEVLPATRERLSLTGWFRRRA